MKTHDTDSMINTEPLAKKQAVDLVREDLEESGRSRKEKESKLPEVVSDVIEAAVDVAVEIIDALF